MNRPLRIESLEQRTVLSANPIVSLDAGVLSIEGTDQEDTIYVREHHDKILVYVQAAGADGGAGAAEKVMFDGAQVNEILVHGNDGDDRIANVTDRNMTAYGNEGNDILHGDRGNDWMRGGDDDDIVFAFFGNDRMIGGKGADMLCGGEDQDTYVGIDNHDSGYDPDQELISERQSHEDKRMDQETRDIFKTEIHELHTLAKEIGQRVEKD